MIISHRGYWLKEKEKNTSESFERSFSLGFGTETDIRDYNGKLVISHDIPTGKEITLKRFLEIYCNYDKTLTLALNIKSDGLQTHLNFLLKKYNIENYFVFDMSIPDTLGYINNKVVFYTRQSEYEQTPSFYKKSDGVWLDEFYSHWVNTEVINYHIKNNKKVCIVSPELHKRDSSIEWSNYKKHFDLVNNPLISICTDKPEEAKTFFEWK